MIVETERLILRRFAEDDAEFALALLSEPPFLRYIGDKGVRTVDDARAYIRDQPLASYARHGFGLYVVELKETAAPIGMCGLLKRDALADPDLGFAFLSRFWSRGYALEAARATLEHARTGLGMSRVVAITTPDNEASIRLLTRLGFAFETLVRISEGAPELNLFAVAL